MPAATTRSRWPGLPPRPRRRRRDDSSPTPPDRASAPPRERTSESPPLARVHAPRRAAASTARLVPAVVPDQRDEANRRNLVLLDLPIPAIGDDELLLFPIADRNQQAATLRQLVEERLRNRGRAGAHENGVVRRVL